MVAHAHIRFRSSKWGSQFLCGFMGSRYLGLLIMYACISNDIGIEYGSKCLLIAM